MSDPDEIRAQIGDLGWLRMVPLTIAEAISHIEHLRREVATFRQFADIALVQVVDAELSARSPSASPSPPSPGTSER